RAHRSAARRLPLGAGSAEAAQQRAHGRRGGRLAPAVQELVRAIFAEQADAHRITIDRASTAQELASAAGTARPQHAAGFTALAALFDEVSFSGGEVTRSDWDSCRALDDSVAGRARAGGGA